MSGGGQGATNNGVTGGGLGGGGVGVGGGGGGSGVGVLGSSSSTLGGFVNSGLSLQFKNKVRVRTRVAGLTTSTATASGTDTDEDDHRRHNSHGYIHTLQQQQSSAVYQRVNSSALRSSDGDVDSAEDAELSVGSSVEVVRPKHQRHSGSYVLGSGASAAAVAAATAAAGNLSVVSGSVVAGSVSSIVASAGAAAAANNGGAATPAASLQSGGGAPLVASNNGGLMNVSLVSGGADDVQGVAGGAGVGVLSASGVNSATGGSGIGGSVPSQVHSYLNNIRGSLLMTDASLEPATSSLNGSAQKLDNSLHGLEFGLESMHLSSLRSAADSSDAGVGAEATPAVPTSLLSSPQRHTPVMLRHRGHSNVNNSGWSSHGRGTSNKQRLHPLATSGALVSGAASSVSSYDGGASSSQSPRGSLSPRKFEREEVRRIAQMSLEEIVRLLQRAVHEEEASSRGEDTSPASQ